MQIKFINNDGAGYSDKLEITPGLTISGLFSQQMSGRMPNNYVIRVNLKSVASDYLLQQDDVVSFTAKKITGALALAA